MLEDKYLSTENMWVLNLPAWLEKPVFAVVHFCCRVKYTLEYAMYIWKHNLGFDLDYMELSELFVFKLERMKKQMEFIGNLKASKQIEQSLMYLEQYTNAEDYVNVPEKFQKMTASDLFNIGLDEEGNLTFDSNLDDESTQEYGKYLANVSDYADESWKLFWKSLETNVTNWQ